MKTHQTAKLPSPFALAMNSPLDNEPLVPGFSGRSSVFYHFDSIRDRIRKSGALDRARRAAKNSAA